MPRTLPDAVYSSLLEALPSNQPVSRDDLRRYDIPQPVAHFLEHALSRRLELETARIQDLAADWVDHDRSEVVKARADYTDLLSRHAHYPESEWPRALRQAVQLVCAYLVRPVPTTIHFVFGERTVGLSPEDVQRRVAYFSGYSHLRTAVSAVIERQTGDLIERHALSEALEAVDARICEDYSSDDWRALVAPLTGLGSYTPEGTLPVDVLARFFESRSGHAMASGVRGYARARELDELTPEEVDASISLAAGEGGAVGEDYEAAVLSLLPGAEEAGTLRAEDDLAPAAEPEPEPAPDPAPTPPRPLSMVSAPVVTGPIAGPESPDKLHLVIEDSELDPDEEPEPLWARFRAQTPVPEPKDEDKNEDAEQPLWKRFQDGSAGRGLTPIPVPEEPSRSIPLHPTPGPAPESDLDSATLEFAILGPAAWQRDTFIDRLFGGSSEGYFDSLNRILQASDWRAASEIITVDVFRANRVNIYDEAAIDFTNAVDAQFRKR
ncbi:MAG: hypothetical protein ACI9W4_001023 [Rhodothermales bacterium]|jgi:hypothetical protein